MDRQADACAGMLLGRRTFEEFRGYRSAHTDGPAGAYYSPTGTRR